MVGDPKEPARTRSLPLACGYLRRANKCPDIADTVLHALHILGETYDTLMENLRVPIELVVVPHAIPLTE
ncbi:MAG: hypothetical protein JWO59_3378 [Chloroflexi bacterium]|nr:hypothetical protein [Chloroflexota bacterium]